jgi:hypothetical protein
MNGDKKPPHIGHEHLRPFNQRIAILFSISLHRMLYAVGQVQTVTTRKRPALIIVLAEAAGRLHSVDKGDRWLAR